MSSTVSSTSAVCPQLTAELATALAKSGVTEFDSLLAYEACGSTMEEAAKFYSNQGGELKVQAAALNSSQTSNGLIVVAKQQSAGRGREGRSFVSKRDSGVWATFGFNYPTAVQLGGLSLAIGVGISEALARQDVEVGLKWPNDVVVSRPGKPLAKLAGVLIESTLRQQGDSNVRIGVGLNLEPAQSSDFVSVGLSQLRLEQDLTPLTYEDAFVLLTQAVADTWREFIATGFSGFASRWTSSSIMAEKSVSFTLNGATKQGVVKGVASDGALIVQPPNEAAISIYGGEVKLLDATSY